MVLILGLESTAHTFGVSVVESSGNEIKSKNVRILSNEKAVFTTKTGGLKPAKVADFLQENAVRVLEKAISKANINPKEIDAIAFSQGPGIGHCLRIGAITARSLAVLLKKPLIGVNHCIAHLEIARVLTKANDPVLLYTSGANTQVIAFANRKYRIFGETLDIGVGNLLDSIGRLLGLGFPAGPKIEYLALKADKKKLLRMPYTVKGMDVSFGGLYTWVKQAIEKHVYKPEDIAYSLQETVFAMLLEVSERAMAHLKKQELALGGGVACNKRLQEMARIMCEQRNAKVFIPKKEFLVDNAAMIAVTGLLQFKSKANILKPEQAVIKPYQRTDDVVVRWM